VDEKALKGPFNELKLQAALKRAEPIHGVADGGGLVFSITKSGYAGWTFRYRAKGRRREMTLAAYPALTLSDARKWARKLSVQVAEGKDPGAIKQAEKQQDQERPETVAELCQTYLDEVVKAGPGRKGMKHPKIPESRIRNHIIPTIGKIPVVDVTPVDIRKAFTHGLVRSEKQPDGTVKTYTTPTISNDVLQLLKQMFEHACLVYGLENNPALRYRPKHAGGTEGHRSRWLTEDEIRKLFAAMPACATFGRQNELTIKLLLLLACRKTELTAAAWSEMDLDGAVWHLPAARTKTSTAINIPLPTLAVVWLRELKETAGDSLWVFPARRRSAKQRHQTISPDTLNAAMAKVDHGLAPFVLHDLRRTARTHLSRLGFAQDVLEKILNHNPGGIRGVYDQYDWLDERRVAMDAWADKLQSLEPDRGPNVVSIRSAAA
jgi:integrase